MLSREGGRIHIVQESFLIKEEVDEANNNPDIDVEEVELRKKANFKAEDLEDVDEELDECDERTVCSKEGV